MLDSGSFGPIVVLFWLVNNLFLLVMSLFFVDGRVPYRKSERVMVKMPCRVRYKGEEYSGMTKDASETGIALKLPKPYFFDENESVEIFLDTDDYHVDVFATVVHVSQWEDEWNYSLKITDINGSYDELLGILYDRVPTVPTEIKKDSGSFEDLKLNLKKRVTPPFYQKRNYPRVLIDEKLPCLTEGIDFVKVFDYNYVCVTVEDDDMPKELRLVVENDIVLECQFETEIRKGLQLYNVANYREIVNDKRMRNVILAWLVEKSAKHRQEEKTVVRMRSEKTGEFDEIGLLE